MFGSLAAFGCGSNEVAEAVLSTGPVCPECQASAGGETSDFGGDQSECARFYQRRSITLEAAAQLGFDVAELNAIVAEPLASSFAWRTFEDFISGDRQWATGAEPIGYQPETSITVSLRLTGGVTHGRFDPDRCDAAGFCQEPDSPTTAQCVLSDPRGRLSVDAEVQLEMADGSIEVTTAVELTSWAFAGLRASFYVDLSSVSGTLRLSPARPGPYRGRLHAELYLNPGNFRGLFEPEIISANPSITDEWLHRPLQGYFPADDECRVYEAPVDPNTSQGQAITSEVANLYSRLQPLADVTSPFGVRWSAPPPGNERAEGARTSLHVELSPVARVLCSSPEGVLSLATDVQLRTEDGSFSWATELRGGMRQARGNEPAELQLFADEYLKSDARFWSRSAPGVELFGSQAGRVFLSTGIVEYVDRVEPRAQLVVTAVPACELDPRCERGAVDCASCGRRLRVAGFVDVIPAEPPRPVDAPPSP